jgi:hypothetical protein
MLITHTIAFGATPAHTSTRAIDPTEARRLARIIQRLITASDREAAALWGPDYRGLLCHLFSSSGLTPLTPSVGLVLDAERRVQGFRLDCDLISYSDLPTSMETAGSPILAQAPNANLGRACSTPAIEERLARHLHKVPPPDAILEALGDLGLELERLPLATANKIARAIISEAIRNAINPEQAGALHLLRAFGPTLRQALIRPLFAADGRAELRRELLLQAPILALVPRVLYSHAGKSPKEALRSIGLPVEARRILPRALSPVARWMHLDGRELTAADLGWLTPAFCNALPETTPGQLAVLNLALELLLGHLDDAAVAERCTWASRHAAELFTKDACGVRDWLLADPALLKRAGIQPWHPAIGATVALDAAAATDAIHAIIKDAERSAPFALPSWAHRQRLPNSSWQLVPITDEIGLIGAGARLANCAAIYGPACRTGLTIIAEIRRPITAKPAGMAALPSDCGEEIGAMVEITRRWDRWQLVQARGFANDEPRASAVEAVARFLATLNGEG